jgi:hypothetical protein
VLHSLVLVLPLALAGSVLLGPRCASAQITDRLPDDVREAARRDFHGADGVGKDGPLAKAGPTLVALYHEHRAHRASGASGPFEPVTEARVLDGYVPIEAIAADSAAALQADLEALGLTDAAAAGRLVSGRLPIEAIPAMAHLSSLRGARPVRAQTRAMPLPRDAASTDTASTDGAPPPDAASTGEATHAVEVRLPPLAWMLATLAALLTLGGVAFLLRRA